MATPSHFALRAALVVTVLVNPTPITVCADIVLEEGYTVTTVFDGNKHHINPYSVLPLSLSSSDLIVLDSVGSAFYTLSFPNSQDSVIKKYSGPGRGVAGFSDGELGSAMFNKPKSFTIDFKGNVYVADQTNHAIRKISKSGVTKLLEVIHKSQAIKMDLHKITRNALGLASGFGCGFSCLLLGLIAGFYIRPYVVHREGSSRLHYSETWKHFPNQSGEESTDTLLRLQKRNC